MAEHSVRSPMDSEDVACEAVDEHSDCWEVYREGCTYARESEHRLKALDDELMRTPKGWISRGFRSGLGGNPVR